MNSNPTQRSAHGCLTKFVKNQLRILLALSLTVGLSACGTKSATVSDAPESGVEASKTDATKSEMETAEPNATTSEAASKTFATEALNRKLEQASLTVGSGGDANSSLFDYKIGAGDILELAVFQVEELSRRVRVNGRGMIMLPLLGEVRANAKTTAELEADLAQQLGDKYLQNPQVSVFVSEYRSQQITVMGAVNQPMVHNVQQPRTLLEVLSMSGGLTTEASKQIHVKTSRVDSNGAPVRESFVIDLLQMIDSGDAKANMVLQSGDTVFVPQAGVVFVEGYVTRPGAYPMNGPVNVLKAMALAGGVLDVADQKSVQVLRQDSGGSTEVIDVDLESIRTEGATDIALEDGDIVVVQADGIKKTWSGFWRGVSGIFGFSKGL